MALLLSLTSALTACLGGAREVPGDQANPKLAAMLQKELDAAIARMNPVFSPGLLPAAPEHARQWLSQIDEVVARCRFGPRNRTRFNLLEYDITLRSGEVIDSVHSGQRCAYGIHTPLVMRARFEAGQVIEVFTDGRERRFPVDAATLEAQQFARSVLRADRKRRPALYSPPLPSAQDNAREWEQPSR